LKLIITGGVKGLSRRYGLKNDIKKESCHKSWMNIIVNTEKGGEHNSVYENIS